METFLDVLQLLKKYGIFIYIGDRLAEFNLMEQEINELYQNKLITNEEYMRALLIVRKERSKYS
ncbi:YqgQ family protein [Allobacillus sp. GCM10007491]|uniref:YqgQ family protein n=1 Tax=Allobacillus saliphilus TaxID=2912308 RepID=A0A941CWC4_9BACI|nr:YqgQ family protein [Allobacillus saliphilus]MBR7554376.1 YqgQ family protein [Allobacillus saliphilus]